jgi:RHS repeat-associated protein
MKMTCFGVMPALALPASKRFVFSLFQTLLCLLLVNVLAASAQDVAGLEQGIKPYGAYDGGDIDSISMVNGNLTLHIPLISFPQRGGKLHLGFSVVYRNPVYTFVINLNAHHQCAIRCFTWSMGTASNPYGGSGLAVALDVPSIGEVFSPPLQSGGCPIINNYKAIEPDGADHQMANTNSGWAMSTDTTGYTFSASGGVMRDRQGTQYSYYPLPSYSGGLLCYTLPYPLNRVTDANGNYISSNLDPNNSTNILSYTDTMGRVIPNWPQTGTSISQCPNQGLAGNGLLAVTSASTWSFPGPNGVASTFIVCYAAFPLSYTPNNCTGYSNCYGLSGSNIQIQSVVLPNLTAWNFAFDTTGALSKITLPTGGSISYGPWGQDYYCIPQTGTTVTGASIISQLTANATSRSVDANDGNGPHQWQYSLTPTAVGDLSATGQTVVTDPYGNVAVHNLTALKSGTSGSCSLYETELDEYAGSQSGTLLRKTVTGYNFSNYAGSNPYATALNVVPTTITTTDVPSGRSSKVTKSWDSGVSIGGGLSAIYGDMLSKSDFDFSGTNPLRTTTNTYMALSGPNASSYLNYNLLDLPYTVQVTNGSSQVAYTTYGYDESALQTPNPPVTEQKAGGIPYPGNQTSVHRWLNISTVGTTNCAAITNNYAVTTNVFFNTGEAQSVTDPCGHPPTTYLYSNTYYGAYPTTVTNSLGQITTYGYDFNTGSVTSIQDPNSQTTSKTYDMMDRLLSVAYPDTGSTSYCYTDGVTTACPSGNAGNAPFAVVETKAITSSPAVNEISTAIVDGLGRLSQTQLNSDPSGTTFTKTTYDSVGRKSTVYNPTRCSSITTNCDNESTWGVTTYTLYDALNRVKTVTEQDGSVVTTTYDQTNANNTGVCTTDTDEAGKSRQSCVDGLGRMTGIWEDPGTTSHLNYETDYAYDALNNLLSVTQKGSGGTPRVRTFTYDSLSRLACAANPEIQAVTCPASATSSFPAGAITYTYDADGNVFTKTAPLQNQTILSTTVTTTYAYDDLNHLLSKTYTDSTPKAQFQYDGTPALTGCTTTPPSLTDNYKIGRRTEMCDGSGATSWSHDKMGRSLSEKRIINAQTQTTSYTYNLDGSLNTLTYPGTGKIITYTPAGDGRPTAAQDTADSINYAESAIYAPPGELAGVVIGKTSSFGGINVANTFNSRLQPLQMYITTATISGTTLTQLQSMTCPTVSASIMGRSYNFSAGSSDNGNVQSITNCLTTARSQNFLYDPLNRIWQAYSSGSNWGETYSSTAYAAGTAFSSAYAGIIDAWGNLTHRSGVTFKTNTDSLNVTALTNNQLTGFTYDAAGNMTINSGANYQYDAENRLITTAGYTYTYDGDGNRVEKSSGSTGTLYWRGPSGDPISESSLTGTSQEEYIFFGGSRIARRDVTGSVVHYYFSDHLGSHAMVENATGSSCEQDIDYYPYGDVEEDYCPNVSQHYKFTGKERDAESSLDYFGARYYGNSLARWMSPDLINVTEDRVLNPANTLSKYAYGGNNPLKYVDTNGRDITFFYDRGGIAGHAILYAYDQSSGSWAIESFGPKVSAPIWKGESMYEMKDFTSADDLRSQLTALTIQTTPEVTQEVISYIREHPDPALWVCTGPNCSTQVWKILNNFKLAQKSRSDGNPGGLPKNLWQLLVHQYNPGQDGTVPRNGIDYGHPHFDMFNLLWLSLPQAKPTASVTATTCVTDPNGKKVCTTQ